MILILISLEELTTEVDEGMSKARVCAACSIGLVPYHLVLTMDSCRVVVTLGRVKCFLLLGVDHVNELVLYRLLDERM